MNIYNLLNPSGQFDFSKYDKIDQDSLFDLRNWERFDEDHQFYVLRYLCDTQIPSFEPEAINIIKEDIRKFQNRIGDDVPSRLVLAAIALSKIDGEDAIDVIFEHINNSFSWVKHAAKEYLTERLDLEDNSQIRMKISSIKEL